MLVQLSLGTVMIVATVIFHVACLVYLAKWLRRTAPGIGSANAPHRVIFRLVATALVIIAIHTVEAWSWAGLYIALGEFTDLTRALYFSVVTSTTLGYGDITLTERWQLLGTFESMGGLILFGASTAFLIGIMRHMFDDQSSPS